MMLIVKVNLDENQSGMELSMGFGRQWPPLIFFFFLKYISIYIGINFSNFVL